MTLYSLHGFARPPTLEQAATQLGVPATALDASYGVVLLDPRRGTYSVALTADAPTPTPQPNVEGPWSNPDITPLS